MLSECNPLEYPARRLCPARRVRAAIRNARPPFVRSSSRAAGTLAVEPRNCTYPLSLMAALDFVVVGHDRADVTVPRSSGGPSDLVGRGDHARPDRGRRSLRNRFELERRVCASAARSWFI